MTVARRIAVLRAIAVFGAFAAVLVAIVAWWFVADVERNLDQSLTIGEEAATTLTETIDVADDVVVSLDAGLGTLERTLAAVDGSIGDTAAVAESTADLAATLPASFDQIDAALSTVESIGATIDGALRAVSALPFGPDYSPSTPFPDAVAELRAAFTPIGEDLDAIASELAGFADGSTDLRSEIGTVRSDVQRTKDALSESGRLLDRYRVTAEQAGALAASSRADLDRSATMARIAALVVALLVLASQCIPWWFADHLDEGRAPVGVGGDGIDGAELDHDHDHDRELHDTTRR